MTFRLSPGFFLMFRQNNVRPRQFYLTIFRKPNDAFYSVPFSRLWCYTIIVTCFFCSLLGRYPSGLLFAYKDSSGSMPATANILAAVRVEQFGLKHHLTLAFLANHFVSSLCPGISSLIRISGHQIPGGHPGMTAASRPPFRLF
ncbi:Uncharacterised protein [Mycobacterium tuberculosis]|nr:Uncharacterised protein [Mycobacterium tuberculosis]